MISGKPIRILFVCMGNICRSPAAEGIFKSRAEARGQGKFFQVDSAGTHGYHEGDPADERMIAAGRRRGYEFDSISRPFRAGDFEKFDLILVADHQNMRAIKAQDRAGKYHQKVRLMLEFHPDSPTDEVPDPYYGGEQGFEDVMDLLEASSEGLLDHFNEKTAW